VDLRRDAWVRTPVSRVVDADRVVAGQDAAKVVHEEG
jgi:hypothetical protein